MILIDSVFVNVGGTKVLLEYILSKIKISSDEYFLLLDYRSENNLDFNLEGVNYKYIKGFFERRKFYKENGREFSKILCFGNIPPSYKMDNAEVFTYFHQQLFLEVPKDFSFIRKFFYQAKVMILRSLIKNSDQWLVQSPLISQSLSGKFNISPNFIKVLPFYPPLHNDNEYLRIKNTFIYVSNATPHKNHYRLIDAFCHFYDKLHLGKLTLTIPSSSTELLNYIEKKIEIGYPINNIGFLHRDSLFEQYSLNEYLIFPSLAESFGLGLVEAIDCGCKVIAADLPYTYQVCNPSLTFDPLKTDSILEALFKTQDSHYIPKSVKNVSDNIDILMNMLQD